MSHFVIELFCPRDTHDVYFHSLLMPIMGQTPSDMCRVFNKHSNGICPFMTFYNGRDVIVTKILKVLSWDQKKFESMMSFTRFLVINRQKETWKIFFLTHKDTSTMNLPNIQKH